LKATGPGPLGDYKDVARIALVIREAENAALECAAELCKAGIDKTGRTLAIRDVSGLNVVSDGRLER
jgi:hypothetical protein